MLLGRLSVRPAPKVPLRSAGGRAGVAACFPVCSLASARETGGVRNYADSSRQDRPRPPRTEGHRPDVWPKLARSGVT